MVILSCSIALSSFCSYFSLYRFLRASISCKRLCPRATWVSLSWISSFIWVSRLQRTERDSLMQVRRSKIVCFLNFFRCFSQHSSHIAMCSVRHNQKASRLSALPFFRIGWLGQGLTIKSESPIKRSSFFGMFANASLPSRRKATGSPIIPTFYLVCK